MSNLQRRLDALEQAQRAKRDADQKALFERLFSQLTDEEIASIDPHLMTLSDADLEAVLSGAMVPDWQPSPIPAALLEKLQGLCLNDYERQLLTG